MPALPGDRLQVGARPVTWSDHGHRADRGRMVPAFLGTGWEGVTAGAPVKAVTLLFLLPGRHFIRS